MILRYLCLMEDAIILDLLDKLSASESSRKKFLEAVRQLPESQRNMELEDIESGIACITMKLMQHLTVTLNSWVAKWLPMSTNLTTPCWHWWRKLLKVRGTTLLNRGDFLWQKLQSYGEALNLRGAMTPLAPLFPPPMLAGDQCVT